VEKVVDPMANLPKNPPIYKATGFDPEPLEKAAELSRQVNTIYLFNNDINQLFNHPYFIIIYYSTLFNIICLKYGTKGQYVELVKKEKAAQKSFNEERQQHMGQAQATKPQLKRAEREARQLLEKQRMEANQLVSNAT
jgi:hypothetical protein